MRKNRKREVEMYSISWIGRLSEFQEESSLPFRYYLLRFLWKFCLSHEVGMGKDQPGLARDYVFAIHLRFNSVCDCDSVSLLFLLSSTVSGVALCNSLVSATMLLLVLEEMERDQEGAREGKELRGVIWDGPFWVKLQTKPNFFKRNVYASLSLFHGRFEIT